MGESGSLLPSLSLPLCGILLLAIGILLRRRREWMTYALTLAGGPPASEKELKRIPLLLAAVGASWLIVFIGEHFPYPHAQRPFFVPLLNLILHPLAVLAFGGLVLWLALFRRFTR